MLKKNNTIYVRARKPDFLNIAVNKAVPTHIQNYLLATMKEPLRLSNWIPVGCQILWSVEHLVKDKT